jgi:protein-S-isoprenylcysteine O-methyltransferase Ste14
MPTELVFRLLLLAVLADAYGVEYHDYAQTTDRLWPRF